MNIYYDIYNIIETTIYGGNMDEYTNLVCTLISTAGCIFLVALPFAIFYKIIKAMTNI